MANLMKLSKSITIVSLITLLLSISKMTNAQSPLLTEIINVYSASSNHGVHIDVTNVLQKYIPIGSTVEKAKIVLVANDFVVTTNHANGGNYLSGRKVLKRSLFRFDEANLTMKIVDEKIATSSGSIFRHAL